MKKKLKELRAKVAQLRESGRAKLAELQALEAKIAALKEGEDRTALDTQIKALNKDIDTLSGDLEQTRDALADVERRTEREALFTGAADDRRNIIITSGEPDPALTAGFHNLADFALAVRGAVVNGATGLDPRLQAMLEQPRTGAAPSNYMQESGGAANEGYMVPPTYRDQVWDLVMDEDEPDFLQQVDMEPTAGNQTTVPADVTTPWGTAGVQAYWRTEAAQMTASKLAQIERDIKLGELYAFVLATEELMEDAPRLNDRLTRKAAAAIRWKASDAIMWGDGVAKPFGFMNSQYAGRVDVAKENAQAAATINATNIGKMAARMVPGSFRRASWLTQPDCLPALMTMTIGDQPIWTPPNQGLKDAPGGLLLGRPIQFTQHSQTLGTLGDIVFADLMGYYAARKTSGIKFAASMHLYFDYNMGAFRWTFRLAGTPYLKEAVNPARGSSTMSHFVALATRS